MWCGRVGQELKTRRACFGDRVEDKLECVDKASCDADIKKQILVGGTLPPRKPLDPA